MKTCPICSRSLPEDQFANRSDRPGRRFQCLDCERRRARDRMRQLRTERRDERHAAEHATRDGQPVRLTPKGYVSIAREVLGPDADRATLVAEAHILQREDAEAALTPA